MSFHFKKSESPARAVRRVCGEHIGEAQSRLRKSRHPAAIHVVRKEIKKLRAIFQFVRAATGQGAYRKAEKGLRWAAGQLAATRDARVRFQAFKQLAGRYPARRFPVLQKTLLKDCRRESRRFRADDSMVQVKRVLRKTGRRVARLRFAARGWAAIEPGLGQSYRRGQQAWRLARREPSPDLLHEWRKQVKTFRHQLQLVCPKWPPATRKMANQLDQLGTLLGDQHDLDLLQQFIVKHGPAAEVVGLNPLLVTRQKKLRRAALKLGAKVYAAAPAAASCQLGKDWNAWCGNIRK